MPDDDRACFHKHAVSGHVIEMVMRVDDELDWQLGESLNFRKQLLRGRSILESVDDGDAIVADDNAGVGAGGTLRFGYGGENVVAQGFDCEGQGIGGCFLRARRAHKNKQKERNDDGFAHGPVWYRGGGKN
jgi:hypothetical protein